MHWVVFVVLSMQSVALGRVNYCGARMCDHTNSHTFCQYSVQDDRAKMGQPMCNSERFSADMMTHNLQYYSFWLNSIADQFWISDSSVIPTWFTISKTMYKKMAPPPPNKREGPGSDCKGYMEAALSPQDKARILARLNYRRSAAAAGRLRALPAAGNMLKLRWIEDLAREAQRWADQCRPPATPEEHDSCRDLYAISVGQCVASVVGEAPGLLPESMVDLWYIQNMHYKANVTAYEVPMRRSNYYGDFAQMVFAYSYMVGCGRSRFMTVWKGRLRTVERLVCNFAPRGPSAGRPLWVPAAPAAACPSRALPDPALPALCSYQSYLDETHDVDYTMTLEEHMVLNAVFEVERNDSLNHVGAIDEIFLTKMAMVTVENLVIVTESYNSMQKRDIVDKDRDIYNNSNNTTTDTEVNTQNLDEKTTEVNTKPTDDTKKATKQKLNFIGRPKSYNIDELGDIGNQIKANRLERLENRQSAKKNEEADIVYGDYEFTETQEENSSISSLNDLPETYEIDNVTMAAVSVDVNSTTINATSFEDIQTTTVTQDPNAFSSATVNDLNDFINNTAEISDKMIKDYFSNPETVRQLQEELDRMENSLSMLSSTTEMQTSTAGKVRRDLREREEQYGQMNNYDEGAKPALTYKDLARGSASNESSFIDKTPMLNMVMKYMPHLRPYQADFLQKATGGSARPVILLPTFEVVLTAIAFVFCIG